MTSLLQQLGVDPSLLGDILERRHAGASRLWMARQMLWAGLHAFFRTVRAQWMFSLRALLVGTVVMTSVTWLAQPYARAANRTFGVGVGNLLLASDQHNLRWAFLHFQLWLLPQVLTTCLAGALAAWIIGRLHRSHRATMVLLFALGVELYYLQWVIGSLFIAIQFWPVSVFPFMAIATTIALIPSVTIAGLWGVRVRRG